VERRVSTHSDLTKAASRPAARACALRAATRRHTAARPAVGGEGRADRQPDVLVVEDALQLLDVRQPPVRMPREAAPRVQPANERAERIGPYVHSALVMDAAISALLLPHQMRVEVTDGSIAVVGVGQYATSLNLTILPRAAAGDHAAVAIPAGRLPRSREPPST